MASEPSKAEPAIKRLRRTYLACLNCRVRKVKCDLGAYGSPRNRCVRCERERRDCIFVDSEKRRVSSVRNSISSESRSPTPDQLEKNGDIPKNFTSVEGALVFLANAAGKITTADERDNIDVREKHTQLEKTANSGPGTPGSPSGNRLSIPRTGTDSSDLYNTPPAYLVSDYTYLNKAHESGRYVMPPAEHSFAARPSGVNGLKNIDYIGPNGILEAIEAEQLINFFFSTMHPFFPYIPEFLHSAETLSKYPLLLCAILTISSRYHIKTISDNPQEDRSFEIHDRLWIYVQRLISQTVWAEASTRSIGTVFAFLLFTEWNPRAIHWRWTDYANKEDDTVKAKVASDATFEPASIGAMRRSYRMGWMLIGSAVRLAQDTGFMECSPKTFLATHIAEINSVTNMRRRSMLAHSLAEVDLDTNDLTEAEMEQQESKSNVLHFPDADEHKLQPEEVLKFTKNQKAHLELLQIMSVGHESLYGYKEQQGSLDQRQILSVLNVMSPMLSLWGRNHKSLLVPSTSKLARKVTPENLAQPAGKVSQELAKCITSESFIFEFNYTKLYIYSLALSPSTNGKKLSNNSRHTLKLDEISRSAKYIMKAFTAANEILQVAHRVHRLKMLRFMPVRWVTRIVRAVAFIVKCYLTIIAHRSSGDLEAPNSNSDTLDAAILSLSLISVEEIVQSIQKAAITLRDCSPDELHLCTRYSNVLMYLSSQMKATLQRIQACKSDIVHEGFDKHDVPQVSPRDKTKNPDPPVPMSPSQDVIDQTLGDTEVIDWFVNNKNIGLDFVGPWTELIEQQIENNNLNFDSFLEFN